MATMAEVGLVQSQGQDLPDFPQESFAQGLWLTTAFLDMELEQKRSSHMDGMDTVWGSSCVP